MQCFMLPAILSVFGGYCYDWDKSQLTLDITVTGQCVIVETQRVKPEQLETAAQNLANKINNCYNLERLYSGAK